MKYSLLWKWYGPFGYEGDIAGVDGSSLTMSAVSCPLTFLGRSCPWEENIRWAIAEQNLSPLYRLQGPATSDKDIFSSTTREVPRRVLTRMTLPLHVGAPLIGDQHTVRQKQLLLSAARCQPSQWPMVSLQLLHCVYCRNTTAKLLLLLKRYCSNTVVVWRRLKFFAVERVEWAIKKRDSGISSNMRWNKGCYWFPIICIYGSLSRKGDDSRWSAPAGHPHRQIRIAILTCNLYDPILHISISESVCPTVDGCRCWKQQKRESARARANDGNTADLSVRKQKRPHSWSTVLPFLFSLFFSFSFPFPKSERDYTAR